jgi:hypothetical protein
VEHLPPLREGKMSTGANEENVLDATGETQADAWYRAVEKARSLGMLGRSVFPSPAMAGTATAYRRSIFAHSTRIPPKPPHAGSVQ